MQFALVTNFKVTALILWDGDTNEWEPPLGVLAIPVDQMPGVAVGWDYNNGVGTAPVIPPAPVLPAPIPAVISMRQAQRALLNAGLLDAVESGIASMPREAQIDWAKATTVERASPLVAQLAASLSLDAAALDALFVAGAAL